MVAVDRHDQRSGPIWGTVINIRSGLEQQTRRRNVAVAGRDLKPLDPQPAPVTGPEVPAEGDE